MQEINKRVIGVSGYARSGKDTFVKIASNILNKNGYNTKKLAFADGLKSDLDDWLKEKYNVSAWTNDDDEKKLIRPFMVAHGCGKRFQTGGQYWIDKVNQSLSTDNSNNTIYFISDVRFDNEAKWLHENWDGYLVHLKRYSCYTSVLDGKSTNKVLHRSYDDAPNEEELKQDPLVLSQADYKLELENVIEREKRLGNIITLDNLMDNSYLVEEITRCLTKCPFLNIQIT